MEQQQAEYLNKQEEQQLTASSQQAALRAAHDHQQRTVHNEDFLNELRKADLDSERYGWLEDHHPDWFSGAHAVTNRGDEWDQQADLLMKNKRERALAERRPGRLLRNRPFLLASMRGDESPQLDAYQQPGIPGSDEYWQPRVAAAASTPAPASSAEQSRIFGAAEVAADLMTLSRNGAGLESVSTVKTETNVRRQEEEEATTASRVGRVFE